MGFIRVIEMDWVAIQRMLPHRWKRRLLVEDGGRVFISSAIGFRNELEGMLAASDAGQIVVTFKGHRYIDSEWVATVSPKITKSIQRLRAFATANATDKVTQCL